MTRCTLIVLVAVFGICQAAALANCPSSYTNEILCDDFDTYCDGGGHPGDTKCPTSGAARNDQFLKDTWFRWPNPATDDGTEMLVEDDQIYLTSAPWGGRYPTAAGNRPGQMTIRDWAHSGARNGPESGQIRNMIWKLENTFGAGTAAVVGTDANPLVMNFLLDGATAGKIHQGNGYISLALGDDLAQTDYVFHEDCATYCSPPIAHSGARITCAQGNPGGPMPAGCPSAATAPIHASIAVGVMGMLDTDPCHCGVTQHGSTNYHLVVYDGQLWWTLKNENPYTTGGDVTPKGDSTMPPPADIDTPGDFTLNGGCSTTGAKSFNWVTLTIKSTTFDVELLTFQASCSNTANKYYVSSTMEGIPRAYLGAFDTIRLGYGRDCELASSADWVACEGTSVRKTPPQLRAPNAGPLIFDDFVLHGGEGETVAGACCDPSNGVCTDGVLPDNCQSPLIYAGPNTSCSTEMCCPDPFANGDGDNDVDQADFGLWQACFSGAGNAYPAGCECYDRHPSYNPDGDVDSDDFTDFMNCWSGPSVPFDPACDD